jgi:dTDP-4-amino-4,6-dideoxygalactose transaminase
MASRSLEPFSEPIYVTRPLCPPLPAIISKLEEVWASRTLTNMGTQHNLLGEKLKKLLHVPNLSLFNNGTIALTTACHSLELSGEVITTPFTFAATPHVLMWSNIKPVFCDIDHETMNIDAEKIESMITPQTTAILPVHVFGTPCDVDKIQEVADRHGLRVIYDAAHAFGVKIDGVGIGNYGDISMLSFHATKLFHTVEGGALLYKDNNLQTKINLMKNFGIKNEEEVIMTGTNGKMNELQAAVGLVVLDYVELERAKRKKLIQIYKECLKDIEGISFLPDLPNVQSNYQYMVIRINKALFGRSRDDVYDEFKRYNVFTRKYFYPLCSDYSCYKHFPSSAASNLPVANRVVKEVLSLPLYGDLSEADVQKISALLKGFRKKTI